VSSFSERVHACQIRAGGLTLPLESVPHSRAHELACRGWLASQSRSNCIGLT
jgi:hypothetical protein